jgi:hypothetical protein
VGVVTGNAAKTCGDHNFPSIFAKLDYPSILEFIDSSLEQKGFSFYQFAT